MTIKFYKFTNEKIAVNKTLTSELSLSGTLREECSIMNPVILVEADDDIVTYNYCEISAFNRYYYITDITSVRNGLWRISLHVDVLYTYRSEIKAQPAIVGRNESKYNLYMADPMFKTYVNPIIQTLTFPAGFSNSFVHILATNGGGADE